MTEQLGQLSLTDPASSLKTVRHQTALRMIMFHYREWSTCLLNWGKIYGYSYIWHNTECCQIGWSISLFIFISRVHLWLVIWCIMTCIMIVSHTNRLDNFSQSPCTVPSCRYFLTLLSCIHQVGTVLQSVYPRINNQPIREAAGGGMVYCTNWIRLRDAKKHTIKAFLVIQRWSNIPTNTKVLSLWWE